MSADLPSVFAVQQDKRPSLCADFSWTFVGNSIYAGGQFAMLVLLAKLVRPELVGQYALGLAVVYPVTMLTNLQLRAVMTSGARRQTDFRAMTFGELDTHAVFERRGRVPAEMEKLPERPVRVPP